MIVSTGRWRTVLLLLAGATCVGCARKQVVAAPSMVTVTLRVTNNLEGALDVSAARGSAVLWRAQVLPKSEAEAKLGELPQSAVVTLSAMDARGSLVSLRDSVPVSRGLLVWIIP